MAGKVDELQSVYQTVSRWPAEQRARLARALIESLASENRAQRPKPAANQIIGALRPDSPPPTDEQVRQWIDEHRMRKCG